MWEWRTVDKIPQQHIMCMFIRGGFLTCHLRPPNNNSDIRMDFTEQHRCGICMYGMIRLYPVWLPRRWDYINSSILPDNSVELSHPTYNNVSDGEDNTPVTQLDGRGDVIEKDQRWSLFKVDYMMGGVGGQTPPGLKDCPWVTCCIFVCYYILYFLFSI